jgi:glycosyltransferase involved in cell wall biosynthesis
MKIGFVGRWSPLDKGAWSGTYYYAYKAIQKYYHTELFFYEWNWQVREKLIMHKQLQKLYNKKAAVEFLKGYASYFSKQLKKELLLKKVDLLFVPSAPQLIAYCKTNIPIVYMTDASFYQLQGYYPLFKNIARYNINEGVEMDKLAFKKASHRMLASSCTKRSVIDDYHIPEEKITVAPLGANIETIPKEEEWRRRKGKVCKLLFLGVEWERKGGQIALETFYALQKSGMPVHLTIIGCEPPDTITDKDITVIPFIHKNNLEGSLQLKMILPDTDFLLLPTRAECAGIIFAEACAFGVPSITTDTGGVTTYIEDKVRWGSSFHTIAENIFN